MYYKSVKQQQEEEKSHISTSLPTFQPAQVNQQWISWHHSSDYSPVIVCSLVWQWVFGSADAIVAVTKSFSCVLSVLPANFTKLLSFILFFRDPQEAAQLLSTPNELISPAQMLIYWKWVQKESGTDSQHRYNFSTTDKSQPAAEVILLLKEQTTAIQVKVAPWENCYIKSHLSTSVEKAATGSCLWREIRWRICSKMVLSDPTSDLCWSKASTSCFLLSPSKFPRQPNCCGCANSSGAAAWPAGERNDSHYIQKIQSWEDTVLGTGSCCEMHSGQLGTDLFISPSIHQSVQNFAIWEDLQSRMCVIHCVQQ